MILTVIGKSLCGLILVLPVIDGKKTLGNKEWLIVNVLPTKASCSMSSEVIRTRRPLDVT